VCAGDPSGQQRPNAPLSGTRARGVFTTLDGVITRFAPGQRNDIILHQTGAVTGHNPDAPPSTDAPEVRSDETLIQLWLGGRSPHTRRAYGADVRSLLAAAGEPIAALTLSDLQSWVESLARLAPASRARKIGAIKSLLSFGERMGYLAFNVGAPLRVPAVTSALAERILERNDVLRLITLELDPRNRTLLRLAYVAGLRTSEICDLRWRDTNARATDGEITVLGKGGKSRQIVLPASMWHELLALHGEATDDDPVFRSAKGGPLDPSQVHRIVKRAAARAGLPSAVSAHYLRHAHVRHALDRGAPARLVQATVGHSDVRITSRYGHTKPNESSATYLSG
jgi:site-specific recombinase XerD